MNYALINGAEIIEKQCGFLYQLEMQHNWQDLVAVYMEFIFLRVQIFVVFGIRVDCSCKYWLPISFMLQKFHLFCINSLSHKWVGHSITLVFDCLYWQFHIAWSNFSYRLEVVGWLNKIAFEQFVFILLVWPVTKTP